MYSLVLWLCTRFMADLFFPPRSSLTLFECEKMPVYEMTEEDRLQTIEKFHQLLSSALCAQRKNSRLYYNALCWSYKRSQSLCANCNLIEKKTVTYLLNYLINKSKKWTFNNEGVMTYCPKDFIQVVQKLKTVCGCKGKNRKKLPHRSTSLSLLLFEKGEITHQNVLLCRCTRFQLIHSFPPSHQVHSVLLAVSWWDI